MKINVDIDKIIKEHSDRRIELMTNLCENIYDNNLTLKVVNELRYLTGMIKELMTLKEKND